jgi:RNA polymerase-binding transcription factor DksA
MATKDYGKERYSDDDLQEFKEIILGKIKESKQDLAIIIDQLSHDKDNSAKDTDHKFNMMEDGAEVMSREDMAQMAYRQEKFISHLKAALVRIENKTYGICRETGKLIAKERLRIVPHATLSIDAKKARQD